MSSGINNLLIQFCGFMFFCFLIGICLAQTTTNRTDKQLYITSHEYGINFVPNLRNEIVDLCETGQRQSPIILLTDNAVLGFYGPIVFTDYDKEFNAIMTKTKRALKLKITSDNPPTISGANLGSSYVLEYIEILWKSEHVLEGVRFTEIQFVHRNCKYSNFVTALENPDGIVTLSTLYYLTEDDNPALQNIISSTIAITYQGHEHELKSLNGKEIQWLSRNIVPMSLLPANTCGYFRYKGSMTTPPCQESVLWFVFTKMRQISERQINVLKRLLEDDIVSKLEPDDDTDYFENNDSPVNLLNGRILFLQLPHTCNHPPSGSGDYTFFQF